MKKLLAISFLAVVATFGLTCGAQAQTGPKVRTDAMDRLGGQGNQFYHAPREMQIIDDRPVIRDFREAPSQAGTIELPPAPGAGGGGGRAAGDSALPTGGLPLGDPAHQGIRSAPNMGLPKSGFGGANSNMGSYHAPLKAMPGVTQGVLGKMNFNKGVGAGAPGGMSPTSGRSAGNYSGPKTASYGGGYGSGTGNASGGSASRTESSVHGHLLKSK